MKVSRSARLAFLLSVTCLILHTERLIAAPGNVPPGACLYALDPTAANAFQIAGAQSVYTACGVVSESSSSSAFQMEGAETLYLENHSQVSVVGGASLTGQTYLYDTISGKDVQAVQTTNPGDPLSALSPPTSGTIVGKSATYYDMNSKPANNTISPGIYCGGLTIGNTNGATFTFSPGVYILAGGGLVLNSQAVVKGTGVTFYNTSSAGWGCSGTSNYMPITISGQVTATLSAPTSGAFDGILFFGNRTGCSSKGSCVDQINGGSTAILNGALYFASDEMEITASNATGYTMLVADKVYINGNSTFGIDGDPLDGITVSVSPTTATLYGNQTQQFTATVTNTVNSVVNWSISPTGVGTISSSGLYTAPANITSQQTVTVTATSQADNSKSGTATITLAVTKTTPTITWPTPAAITYGTALSANQLDATANVAGTFAYTPAAGTVLTAGSQTLSVTFTPTNTTLYNSATDSVTLTVNKAMPVVTWATPAAITYGTALSSTQLDATANVAGAFAYSPTAGTVLAAGSRTLNVTFTPTDTADYTAATASVTLTVNKATPVISWATPSAINYGTALGSMQLNATSNVPGTFAYSPAAGAVLTAGNQTLSTTFTPTDTADYTNATASVTQTVNRVAPVITWPTPGPIVFGTALSAAQLNATANVPGTFVYSPAAGTVLTAGSQTLNVAFTPTDATDYTTATASVTLTVNQTTPVVTWATPSSITYGTALSIAQLDATSSVPGTFVYSPTAGTVLTAGNQNLSVTFTPTDATDYATATASVTLTVNQATPVITWATPSSIASGTALGSTQLDATANVPGSFAYSPATGTVLTAGSQTLNVTFTPTDATDYTTATATVVLTVTQSTQCNNANGYSYLRTITIPHTNVPNTDQINFPFLFSVTDPLLATAANGGHVVNPNGYDIIFTSDAAGQNPLNYEMEEYNPATGQVVAWVQISDLSHTTDTTIYLFYGNSSITASQQNPTSVWDPNYKAVWHVPNGTQLSLLDSTSNGNNGTDNGAVAAAGEIDGGMLTNGSTYATIGTPADLANLAQGNATFSAWVNSPLNPNGGVIMAKDDADISSGWTLGLDNSNDVDFSVIFNNANFVLLSQQPIPSNQWTYVVVTVAGTPTQAVGTMYVNGVPSDNSIGGFAQTTDDSADILYLANATFGDAAGQPLNGLTDEFRISNTVRSADWIATEYANQSSPSTFYNFSGEGLAISPGSATLHESGTQQFTATALNSCVSGAISWSITPTDAGTITQNGFYTAPSSLASEETVTITAASQSGASASVIVTLIPPVAVSVTPAAVTITNGGEQRQFAATVLYAGNTAVTWSVSPSGAGTIDQTGLYTAPGGIPSQQIVTITATSQFDPTRSGTATVTLAPAALPPPICPTSSYSFMRPIAINHNQVPNTDQTNFPFLFNTTDPLFATTDNGGHMTSLNGWDLIFTSDPAGQNPLNYELEEYDPVAGTIIAWIGIPNLSHSSDTVIYMFYGNSSITAPQQNASAVWDSNYQTVFHMANAQSGTALDSTANGLNGVAQGVFPTPGEIDGAGFIEGFGGGQITSNYVQSAATAYTVEAWINTTDQDYAPIKSNQQTSDDHSLSLAVDGFGGCGRGVGCGRLGHASNPVGQALFGDEGAGDFIGVESTTPINDGNWHHVVGTFSAPSGASIAPSQFSIYVDGVPASTPVSISSGSDTSPLAAASSMYMIGTSNFWTGGAVDEFRISTIVRSPDWIAAEYANQSSPSTFYQLYPENPQSVIPSSAALYAAQSEQFTSLNACGAAVTWSMPAGSPGTLSTAGLYSAPPSIATPQSITITATSLSNGTTSGTATVSLLPAITVGVAPASITLLSGQTQQFTATVANATNSSVLWSLSSNGAGTISSAGLYSAPAVVEQVTTVIVTATLESNPAISASAAVTLMPTVTISITPTTGLVAANQSLQFSATVSAPTFQCSGLSCATWSISPSSSGSITNSFFGGLYTAPSSIAPGQTVTVTGSVTVDGVTESASATVTLIPNSPTIAVEPAAVTLTGGQSQQYYATIANQSNDAVTWTVSPSGTGSLSATGLYTAPPVVNAEQVITITATSQAEPSLTASAVLTLEPAQCAAKAYNFVRPIVIDHTKVPSTDQVNFPFYFSVTDPLLATTSNGGHMTSPNGYDIEFSTDPSGQQILNYELEQYNAATGQIVAWVQVPVLSHTQDTVIYMFYGDSAVTGPQQSPAGVWDSNYAAVYQFENLQAVGNFQGGTLLDSTANGNNSTYNNVQETPGEPGGAGIFDGATSYALLPAGDFTSVPYSGVSAPDFNASFGVWFKTSSPGVILGQTDGTGPSGSPGGYVPALYIDANGYLRANFFDLQNAQQIVSSTVLDDNNWHHAVLTFDTNAVQNTVGILGSVSATTSGVETLYVDGSIIGVQSGAVASGYSSGYAYYLGTGYASNWAVTPSNTGWFYFNGDLDQIEISSTARSSAWVQSEFNNQSSPSTFFALGSEAGSIGSLNPPTVTLYQSQGQQFTVLQTGSCNTGGATWSRPAGSPGSLSPTGLYTAPATIDTQQAVTVTATTLGANATPLSATIILMPPVAVSVSPGLSTLPAGGTEQFTAAVTNATNTAVSWTLETNGVGSISQNGVYIAPAVLSAPQTINVVATSQADPSQSASATLFLVPNTSTGPAIAVNPPAVTLSAGQAEQFNATVANESSTAVIWSTTPSGTGSITDSGLYTAPETITSQETVTITATSQADPTLSASAMVTLNPTQCASTGYGYQRVIVIDHTKVANKDQINFPFLFNTTDPDLATVGNGGHVANPNGYDIIFSTDPNGQTRLDFEVEQYNPVTGQVVAWIRIPTLSHSSDTIIYVFYGNPSIAVSQANPSGVWDSNYQAVYHLGALPATGTTADSTSYANNAAFTNFMANAGVIDGAASLDGVTSYLQIPSTAFPSYPISVIPSSFPTSASGNGNSFSATFGIWFKTTDWGGLLDQTSGEGCTDTFLCALLLTPEQPGEVPFGSWAGLLDINFNGQLTSRGAATTQAYNDNNWHYAVVTYQNGVGSLYADGQPVGSGQADTFGFSPTYAYFVGTADVETDDSSLDSQPWKYLNGEIDEINVSSIARSRDWIETQFNNQSSPSTFYTFYSPNAIQVAPSSISLYASQSEQFAVPATCDATITWSLPSGSPGSLTSTGLYTAPSVISAMQSVTVSAVSQSNGSSLGSAQVTLLPAPQPLTIVAAGPSPYQVGTTQSFTATLLDLENNPLNGVAVNFTVAGPNETVGSATTNASGTASFTYTGSTSGTDTVQATASVNGSLLTSNSLTAAWLTPPPAQAPTLMLLPQPSPGRGALVGAFTDNNGAVIEPIVVGSAARTFITPTGATRLQLGINSTYYANNGGAGFVVNVNGVKVTVPPMAMPWNWQTGGLNNNYQFGTNDGSNPVVAAASLTAGQSVTIVYQSGTVSTNYPVNPAVSANGESSFITGTQEFQGAYFPTLYTTGSNYPQNQPVSVFTVATDSSGVPIANAQVTLTVSGANPGQYQATTDATGTASFLYTGQNGGNDSLQAQASASGFGTLDSSQAAIDWVNYPTPPTVGSLSLSFINNAGSFENFSSFAKDASGNVLTNVNVGFYVSGVDNFQTSTTTNNIGQAYFSYNHTQSGNYSVFAVDTVDRNVIVTTPYTGSWNMPAGSSSATAGTITIGISANTTVTIPNALQLNGTVTDSSGQTPTVLWTEVSGPGTVTFANPSQPVTTATFSQLGTYVVQLGATDGINSGAAQFTVTVNAPSVASQSQGWIGSPQYGSAVSGLVPITLASGATLASGTLSYVPTNNPNAVTVLNANVNGSGQIGALDTTALANGSYWIEMQATDTNGHAAYSLVLVTVTGNFKPGRVTSTVTDLVVPSTGLPIQIQRTYDSLNASQSLDFGYGWSLGINVDLVVDPSGNVTFTLGGQRRTFYLTPQAPPCTIAGCLFPYYFVAFTPEPGLHGSLTDSSQGCPLDLVEPYGSLWECYGGTSQYEPPGYIYTDPTGTQYTIGAGGALQSIVNRNGNGLTITSNGITSTTGLNVPFVRDSQGRITQITDPSGNVYLYNYDANGNLSTVFYPNTPQPSTYTYATNHYYLSGTDFRSNPLPSVDYYVAGDTDAEGDSLAGKLKTVTDGLGETTTYAYDLSTNTTTVTYPPDAQSSVGHATMVYDSLGDLLTSTDPLNLTTTNTYDAKQDLLSTTDPLGHTTSYTYDANGNKTSTTYPATATSTNTTSTTYYNQFAEPTSTTDEDGNVRTFNYDANYNPASVIDSVGTLMSTQFNANGMLASGAIGFDISQSPAHASQFSYDANGDLISKTDALGRTTSYTYNALGQKVTMTEPVPTGSTAAAATTTYTYDAFGNLTQTQAPLGRTTSSQYDGNGNKTSDTDARSNTTNYQYDALNRLIETDYPDGTKATRTYDFRNNVVTETDQGGHVTLHQYDISGRQIAVTQAYGTANATTTSYAYDNAGRLTGQTDALRHVTNYAYDAAGNLLSTSGVAGNFSYTYDNTRNRVSETDGDNNLTQLNYDARHRLTLTIGPDQTEMSNAYNGFGNLASVTDQAGNQVQYNYDAANQLVNVVQVDSPNTNANTTSYGYDPLGNTISLADANTHTTFQSFDPLNELTQKVLPDGTLTESRTYDKNGNLATLTHFNGVVTTYTYDQLNRLLSRSTPGETTVSFTYTQTGKRATMTDQSGTTNYSYDSMDRLSAKATPEGTLNYTYDAAGNVASMQSGDGAVNVSYAWNSLNLLEQTVDSRSGTTTYQYDPANNLLTTTYPNQIVNTFTYDTLNRVSSASSPVSNYTYGRGPTGNFTDVIELGGRAVNWSYDGIYRLTQENIQNDQHDEGGSIANGLDPVGNRTSVSSGVPGLSPVAGTYNADDELSAEQYDLNGNVTASSSNTFAYDSQNELTSMNGGAVQIVYDGDGNRVKKAKGGVVTAYLVDDLNPTGYPQVVEELTNSTVSRTYTYGLQRISEYQPISNAWTASFYGYDGGGNVRQLNNTSGAVTDTYEYDAFGNSFTVGGTTPNNFLYQGEQWDPDLGLYYLRARYMNPLTGRFMSRDPEDGDPSSPASQHKYLYADADPVDLSDPTGRATAVAPVAPSPTKPNLLTNQESGALAEYALLTAEVSLVTVAAAPPIAADVNCILFRAAAVLDLVSNPTVTEIRQHGCTATAEEYGNNPGPSRTPGPPPPTRRPPPEKCPEEHPDWPRNYVYFSSTPDIAAHIAAAQAIGYPDGLTYLGKGSPQQDANRAAACGRSKYAGTGMECDEYPYASTAEGGAGASTAPVPPRQQRIQGRQLQTFYSGLGAGQKFCVVVVP